MFAAVLGRLDIVKELLKRPNLNLNHTTSQKESALNIATENHLIAIAQLLREAGAKE